jgi:serine phosphatase RsbU (regulator of sigma subunit)
VLLAPAPGEPLVPRAIRSRTGGGPEAGLAISRSVLDRVLNARQAILSRDAALDFPTSESVSDQRLRSLICAPLLDASQRPIGVVQLDIPDGSGKFGQDDLDLLVAVASQVSIAVEHARMHEQLLSQRELDRELAFSRQVLQALLPEPRNELGGYAFWAFYEPARFVGGDYYGHFPLPRPDDTASGGPPRRWALAVGDVAGKGMPAALLMSKLSAEVRVVLGDEPEPAAAMARLNRLLCETGMPEMFVTFLLAVVDMAEHRLTVVNAGHPSPLVRRASGHLEVPAARALSLPLGVEPGEPFRSLSTTLGPGDLVVLYTDGVIESLDAKGRTLGVERLKQIVHAASPRPDAAGEAVVQAVRRHAGARAQSDDLTLLCIGRPPS